MEYIFTSIFPVFGLILIGYFFKRISFPSHEFWPLADKLTYFILMPSLLIIELTNAKFSPDSLNLILVVLLSLFATLLALILINLLFKTSNASFTSIVQGVIRFNTYVFLALASALFGSEGLVLSAIILTVAIPFVNVCCVTIFAFYSDNNKLGFNYLIKSIIKNPLIIACWGSDQSIWIRNAGQSRKFIKDSKQSRITTWITFYWLCVSDSGLK
ncbi:AEC family transporter [Gallibacterium genomosp. 3]|uniref:AEC family transporter n=1 Tax=Gallibacterium genomosp. 3 TaxID=505345 RepID=UPI001FD7C25C|nr:hypothetical protein [Gallibacterium genomosp. 3]